MFEKKQTNLGPKRTRTTSGGAAAQSASKSKFVQAGLKKQAETTSGNGALKYTTTGNAFVDQFNKTATYKAPRKFSDIEKDCEAQWSENKLMTVCFILYVRMITRIVQLFNGVSTKVSQKGAELRHEGIMRMIWLHTKAPGTFMKNIGLFVSVGSWKDIITMLQYDLVHHGWEGRVLNWDELGDLIKSGLAQENTSELIKKYLPQIKSLSNCNTVEAEADTMIGKWICSLLYGSKKSEKDNSATYKAYRKMKSSGTAHQWQQLISQKKFNKIDFSKIHGRALNKLVRSKFLKNAGLTEAYTKWIGDPKTKDVKYTGFVHELFMNLPSTLSGVPAHQRDTINKQFETLVKKAGEANPDTRLIVVRDTSGSMNSAATSVPQMSSGSIAKAISIYFSYFLKGPFANSWIEFNSDAKMHQYKGEKPIERWYNSEGSYNGNTNFMDVLHLFARIKRQGVEESEFPTGIICISDGNFDKSHLAKTNVAAALDVLRQAGFSKEYCEHFIIALWNIPNNYYSGNKSDLFETFGDVPNVFYMSGYSAAIVAFLTNGKAATAYELFELAMNQEVMEFIEL